MQRARDRRGREREHVGLELELLEPLLVLHTEAMLLVDDDETQIAEIDIGAEQPVRADDDVDLLLGDLDQRRRGLLRALKARERAHGHREIRESLGERASVLLRQNRGGHQHCHLSPRLHGLERRANGDLRLAVADVAHEQAVHRARGLHVRLDLDRRLALIRRVLEEKGGLELALPGGVRKRRDLVGDAAARVEIEELERHLLQRGARLVALRSPALAAELVEARRRRVAAHIVGRAVALDLIDAIERHVEPVAALVLDDRHLDRALAHEHLLDAAIDADAVLEMHHVVARFERGDALERGAGSVAAMATDAPLATEDLVVGEDAKTRLGCARARHDEAAVHHTHRERSR